jgi:hypothetical protein
VAALHTGMRLPALLFVVGLLSGCSLPWDARDLPVPYTQTWTGSAQSSWFNLKGDGYEVESRMAPPGCASRIVMAGRNEYEVVTLWPPFATHVRNPLPPPSSQWTGWSTQLVTGSYRLEGTAPTGCQWSVRISRDLSNAPAPSARCGQLTTIPAGSFVRITGTRVSLPSDSALAQSTQVVQPGNVPLSHFGIGIDDGTGVCAVLWPPGSEVAPSPQMGERVTFTGQVIRDGGKSYLGVTSHP